jgi:hypothetical protein
VSRLAFVIAASLAARVAAAAPSDIIGRPLVLDENQLAADLNLEVSIASLQVGDPASIGPDVWYGVTRELTVGVIQSDPSLDRIPYFFEPGISVCINRDEILCHRRYHGSGLDGLYSLIAGHFAVAAHVRLLLRDINPAKPAITLGATLRWQRGLFSISGDPYLQLGLDNTDLGNRSELWLPVVLAVQPTCRWAVELHTGYDTDLAVWRDGYHVPVEVGVRARATMHFDVGAALGFASILGPQNTPKERVLFFDVGWRS